MECEPPSSARKPILFLLSREIATENLTGVKVSKTLIQTALENRSVRSHRRLLSPSRPALPIKCLALHNTWPWTSSKIGVRHEKDSHGTIPAPRSLATSKGFYSPNCSSLHSDIAGAMAPHPTAVGFNQGHRLTKNVSKARHGHHHGHLPKHHVRAGRDAELCGFAQAEELLQGETAHRDEDGDRDSCEVAGGAGRHEQSGCQALSPSALCTMNPLQSLQPPFCPSSGRERGSSASPPPPPRAAPAAERPLDCQPRPGPAAQQQAALDRDSATTEQLTCTRKQVNK